jgi:hypothetical protein
MNKQEQIEMYFEETYAEIMSELDGLSYDIMNAINSSRLDEIVWEIAEDKFLSGYENYCDDLYEQYKDEQRGL